MGHSDCVRGIKLRITAPECFAVCSTWDTGNWNLAGARPGSASLGVKGTSVHYDHGDSGHHDPGYGDPGHGDPGHGGFDGLEKL